MKVIIKYGSILLLLILSFFYTDKISKFLINRSELMHKIKQVNKNIDPINALIMDNYIIPGLNGYTINELDSYYAMKTIGNYQEDNLKYDVLKPQISLEDNKNKIIKKGNSLKNAVSIIIKDNETIYNYAVQNNISLDLAISQIEYNNQPLEIINNDVDNFDSFHQKLTKSNKNSNICLINELNKSLCIKQKYYLVEPTYYFINESIIDYIPFSGDIILLDDSLNLDIFKWLIKTINYRNYKIIYLSNLISESS